ncbi:hypothetical protein V8G54_014535 [Vigna mungo]|uniref:Uncharacterized protein n=1 Tax=Vigna mungo TaxID=3915 RepID=A0AAQ3NGT3_VIGMU
MWFATSSPSFGLFLPTTVPSLPHSLRPLFSLPRRPLSASLSWAPPSPDQSDDFRGWALPEAPARTDNKGRLSYVRFSFYISYDSNLCCVQLQCFLLMQLWASALHSLFYSLVLLLPGKVDCTVV